MAGQIERMHENLQWYRCRFSLPQRKIVAIFAVLSISMALSFHQMAIVSSHVPTVVEPDPKVVAKDCAPDPKVATPDPEVVAPDPKVVAPGPKDDPGDTLTCCWDRFKQACKKDSDCDPGGEGCIRSGTVTKKYGLAKCVVPVHAPWSSIQDFFVARTHVAHMFVDLIRVCLTCADGLNERAHAGQGG